jgi:hypothetical protein
MTRRGSELSIGESVFDEDAEIPALRRKMRLSSRNLTSVPRIAVSTDSLMLLDLSNNKITVPAPTAGLVLGWLHSRHCSSFEISVPDRSHSLHQWRQRAAWGVVS